MSHSALLTAKDDGQLEETAQYRNSHGLGIFVWDALVTKYMDRIKRIRLGDKRDEQPFEYRNPFDDFERLWKWVSEGSPSRYPKGDPNLPAKLRPWEMNVLVMTYDGAYLHGAKDLQLYADSCRAFVEANANDERVVCHLRQIASDVEVALGDGDVYLAWNMSSLSANPWLVPFSAEDERLFNFQLDSTLSDAEIPRRYHMIDSPAPGSWVSLTDACPTLVVTEAAPPAE